MSEKLSPSGKYKLVTQSINCWASQGDVYAEEKILHTVRRNYSSFPYLFVEDHPKGDFLICGEDYQGQTVINLLTGQRIDHLSDNADEGFGFCWSDYTYNKEHQILVVDGCFWACPYEFRLYDFSDPMNGWAELETDNYIDTDCRPPLFNIDGTITFFQSEDEGDDQSPIAATRTFKRENNKLILINEWISLKEQKIRKDREESNKKYEDWLINFKANDPLYLRMMELIKDPIFHPADYCGIGITYEGWCPDFKKKESCMNRRINDSKSKGYTINLDWAVDTGPVKLTIFKDGNSFEHKFFMDHSVESIEAAFNYSKKLLQE